MSHFREVRFRAFVTASVILASSLFFASDAFCFFFGELRPGLRYVRANEKTGYFLYVPDGYSQKRKWPLIIGLTRWGSSTKDYIEQWTSEAKQRGYIVLCPHWWKSRDALPDVGDEWLLKVIRKVSEKYNVDKKRVLLTGFGDGGDYVYYLALRYPTVFSGAALIGGGLSPSLENLIYFGRIKRHPIPFFVLNGKKDLYLEDRAISMEDIRRMIQKLREHELDVSYQEAEDLGAEYRVDFNVMILNWFEAKVKG